MAEGRARLRTDRAKNAKGGTRRMHPSVRKARGAFMRANTPTEMEVVRRIRQIRVKSKRKRKQDPTVKACIRNKDGPGKRRSK